MPLNGNASVGRDTGAENSCLMGGKATVDLIVSGRVGRALLDTGATVSVINRAKKSDCPSPLSYFIQVVCANGQALPYLGYVTMSYLLSHDSPHGSRQ